MDLHGFSCHSQYVFIEEKINIWRSVTRLYAIAGQSVYRSSTMMEGSSFWPVFMFYCLLIWGTKGHSWFRVGNGVALRVQAFWHKIFWVYLVYCNFILGYMCWITLIFGTLKDWSDLIDIFSSSNCFSYRNIFQNGVEALSKIKDAFLTKSCKFYLVQIIR